MEDAPSCYVALDPYGEETKTYVELEVVQRNINPYDSAAMQLAQQSDLLFNYDSSPPPPQPAMHYIGAPPQQILQYHELEPLPLKNTHIIDLDCPVKSFESIKSVLMLKDVPEAGQSSTGCGEKSEPLPQNSSGDFGERLPFWKERALQIERGTEICTHRNSTWTRTIRWQ